MREISLHMLDILQNSVKAQADEIIIKIIADKGILRIIIEDNGFGIEENILKTIKDPFVTSRKTRDVGLGISLFETSCELAGGRLDIESEKEKGTKVTAQLEIENIDRVPLGSIDETIVSILMDKPKLNIELVLSNGSNKFEFSTMQVREKIADVPINNYEVLEWIKAYVNDGVINIFGGVLNEIVG